MNALERWRNIRYEEYAKAHGNAPLVCIMGHMDYDEVFGTALMVARDQLSDDALDNPRYGAKCEIEGMPCFCSHSFPYGIYFGGVRL